MNVGLLIFKHGLVASITVAYQRQFFSSSLTAKVLHYRVQKSWQRVSEPGCASLPYLCSSRGTVRASL